MSTIYLLNPLTGAAGSTGANGYPDAMNGSAGGAAYTGTVVGNYVINATSVTGGSGGGGGHSYQYGYGVGGNGGSGGAGINLLSGTLTNDGSIIGGQGGIGGYGGYLGHNGNGGSGGAGINLSSDTLTLTVNTSIDGGTGGAGATGGGGHTGGTGGGGGAGVDLAGSTLTTEGNGVTVGGNGGNGGAGYYRQAGGATGGAGGTGGAGVDLSAGSTLTAASAGIFVGGNGGNGGTAGILAQSLGGHGGNGGAGIDLASLSTANLGISIITGGAGGNGSYGAFLGGNGGNGGAGVYLSASSVTLSGNINGGTGSTGGHSANVGGNGGNGGAGVYLNGGSLTTSGTISGGAGGTGGTGKVAANDGSNGAAGVAVQFGASVSTLILDPGAVFNGQVAANTSVNDALQFSGTQSGGTGVTLAGQFTGFSSLEFDRGAEWTAKIVGYVGTNASGFGSPGLAIDGFTTVGNTIDITNIAPNLVAAGFDPATRVLTSSDGTLHFINSPTDEYFVFNGDGGTGTDVTLAAGDGISTTIDSTVTLGSAANPSPLTITSTGSVDPTRAGAIGMLSDVAGNLLTNNGAILGATGKTGTAGGNGGAGLDVKLAATVSNSGEIGGGVGGTGSTGAGGVGGAGVDLLAGTLTNTGTIFGGTGGHSTAGAGGAGGAGVLLSGATLTTSGTIAGGAEGRGSTNGAMGDAVKFGAAGTLNVDPGAVFNGLVVANASVNDLLALSGTQSGGTTITLGTQFKNFSTLVFGPGAKWTADATKAALTVTGHTLHVDGFAAADTLDITNLPAAGTTLSFNATTDVLTLKHGTTTIKLDFDSAFKGYHFTLAADGGKGSDVSLAAGPGAIVAGVAPSVLDFVSDFHRGLTDGRIMPLHGLQPSVLSTTSGAAQDVNGYGIALHAIVDHSLAHAALGPCKA
jgi:hypothetical protein